MSGRLVILRHKSWNVWNQDNREKVLRDQRLHQEEVSRKVEQEKKNSQELNLEILKSTAVDSSSAGDQVVPFRLFEDLEQKVQLQEHNEEYMSEKKKKEDLIKKREGLAEWALGEGSREKTKLTPWYEVLEPVHKKTKTIEATSSSSQDLSTLSKAIPSYLCEKTGSKTAAQLALDRELSRKRQEDPMAQYVKKYDHDHHLVKVVDERAERNYFEMNGFDGGQIEGKETFALEDQAEIKIPEGKKKHSRKESKHSRKSKQKEQEKRKDDSMQSVQITDDAVLLQQLRIKRLQREKEERKKTNVLLATSDIYGPVGSRSLPKPR